MTAPMTPERLAEIRPLAKRYLTEWPNTHAQKAKRIRERFQKNQWIGGTHDFQG